VTDNGPCFKSVRFAAYIERRPELIHIRTRRKSPGQNGVRERAFGSLKYEHLYRIEIDDGHTLGVEAERYRELFNQIRRHEALAMRRPSRSTSRPATTVQSSSQPSPKPCHFREAGHERAGTSVRIRPASSREFSRALRQCRR
jgi:putative transposase